MKAVKHLIASAGRKGGEENMPPAKEKATISNYERKEACAFRRAPYTKKEREIYVI